MGWPRRISLRKRATRTLAGLPLVDIAYGPDAGMEGRRLSYSPRSAPLAVLAVLLVLVCACSEEEASIAEPEARSAADRIGRVERGLVPMTEAAEPQWDRRAELADRMQHYAVPSVGVAVIDGFEIAWSRGYGTLRAGGEDPVTVETLFHAGSVAKCLSAAAALTLVEQGLLDLDGDVNEKLRAWRIPENDLTREEKVTLRRLLSHSGGLEDGFTNRSSADAVPDYFTPEGEAPSVSLRELLDAAPGVDVDGPTRVTAVPGSRYRYANADYVVLELLAGDVTGEPFARFMERVILGPLGLTSSTYEQPLPPDLRTRAAVEHDLSGRPIPGDRLHIPLLAAGALWTTPSDLARFGIEIARTYRGESERILSRGAAMEMLTRQIKIADNPLAEASGLGFQLAGEGEDLYAVHTGGTWGSTSILWIYPATGKGAIVMTNSASGSLLRFEILLAIAREHGWPLVP